MPDVRDNVIVTGIVVLVMAVTATNSLPTGLHSKTRLSNLLDDIQNLRQNSEFSPDLRSNLKREDERRQRKQNYGLIIELKDPVKIAEVPSLTDDSQLADQDVISGLDKRQGRWDEDYGLGGGRFGKRAFDYSLGGGRFGRDVDHVDPMHVEG